MIIQSVNVIQILQILSEKSVIQLHFYQYRNSFDFEGCNPQLLNLLISAYYNGELHDLY